jgi:hypothetical protein
MEQLTLALNQIHFARLYTERLLEHVPQADWFRLPPGGVSHVAWQVGHLAMAEYRLALERIRGRRPEDEHLIPDEFLQRYGRTSTADPDPGHNPPVEVIRTVFDRVHQQVLAELPGLPPEELAQPPLRPHVLCATKGEALLWCSQHEMLHAGQIGLLRRLLGHPPVW